METRYGNRRRIWIVVIPATHGDIPLASTRMRVFHLIPTELRIARSKTMGENECPKDGAGDERSCLTIA